MASATPQAALPQTCANDSVATILYTIEGIINRASNHYVSQDPSVYCGQKPIGHEINQHKEELKAVPSKLENILNSGISDDDWLAMQKLRDILRYAITDKFDWANRRMFDMLSDDFKGIYEHVLRITKPDKAAARPPVYYKPKRNSGGEGLQSSSA